MTHLFRSVPRYLEVSAALSMRTSTTSPVTGPFVPVDQAPGYAINEYDVGDTTRAVNLSLLQPRPNGPQASRRGLLAPQLLSCATVQSAAAFVCGEPVRRA